MSLITISDDIRAVQSVESVSTIMRVVAETIGLRFVCVARVTSESWTTCAVLDRLQFGLQPGDELELASTLCDEVRATDRAVFINEASADPRYCDHHTPKAYGFESYFSVPIYRAGGEFFGTLCGLDPVPLQIDTAKTRDMLTLFADLISHQLESHKKLESANSALNDEREVAELREQFIAILGHDLRTPLSSVLMGAELLNNLVSEPTAVSVLERIERSASRIEGLVDNLLDFTRGRMGNGIPVNMIETDGLAETLNHAVSELESGYANCAIHTDFQFDEKMVCDPHRIAQLFSNLLTNALVHGDISQPVKVSARCKRGALTLSVSNCGNPIPEETQARLFQPFRRGGSKGSSKGLGLGLYIASEIARAHNGRLDVTSTAEATTFAFTADLSAVSA